MKGVRTVALVDESLCTGCQSCLALCPVDSIVFRKGAAKVLSTFCNGCGYCED